MGLDSFRFVSLVPTSPLPRIASWRGLLLAAALAAAGCSAQTPAWERYRAEPDDAAEPPGRAMHIAPPADARGDAPTGAQLDTARRGPGDEVPLEGPFPDLHEFEPYREGIASWYGPGFHGQRTANGEIYNQNGLTAAHPMLPMGTRIRVTNLRNGRRVWVRINDRGPYKKNRILDLSRLAAERLDMIREGTAPVRVDVVRWPETVDTELGLRAYRQYVVQVAADSEPDQAEAKRRELAQRVPWARLRIDRPPGGAFSVVTPPTDDLPQARQVARKLQEEGLTVLVRSYRK